MELETIVIVYFIVALLTFLRILLKPGRMIMNMDVIERIVFGAILSSFWLIVVLFDAAFFFCLDDELRGLY